MASVKQPLAKAKAQAKAPAKRPAKAKSKASGGPKARAKSESKSKSKSKAEPTTIDEYLAPLSKEQRSVLEALRKTIRAAVPKAEECISYHLPAFALDGKCFVWIGAASKHYAVYGLSQVSKGDLKDFETSGRGTIRFWADKPLPAALLRKLVKARIAKAASVKKSTRAR